MRSGTRHLDSGGLTIDEPPAVFQIIDFVCAVALVGNETESFERVDELLGLELRTLQLLYDCSPKGALPTNVSYRSRSPEVRRQLAKERIQVKVFRNRHAIFVGCRDHSSNAAAIGPNSQCTGKLSTES